MKTPRAVATSLAAIILFAAAGARADAGDALIVSAPAWAAPGRSGAPLAIDPIADGVLVGVSASFAATLSIVIGTGEIQPTTPGPTSNLLPLDRLAVTQTIDPHADTYSNVGLYTAVGFAVLDPILSGVREGPRAFVVDGVLYAETIAVTQAVTDLTKIAVRRPRPIDYTTCANAVASCGIGAQLSFFSGHAATVASIGAAATTLAFLRSKGRVRPWVTLGVATALTAFVSVERVRSGEHFPTDVLAGSAVGAAVGILVPELHRHGSRPPLLVGIAPAAGGGTLTASGVF